MLQSVRPSERLWKPDVSQGSLFPSPDSVWEEGRKSSFCRRRVRAGWPNLWSRATVVFFLECFLHAKSCAVLRHGGASIYVWLLWVCA